MASILDGLELEGSVLDGLAEWPASTTRKEWFTITRGLIQQTIADLDRDEPVLSCLNLVSVAERAVIAGLESRVAS